MANYTVNQLVLRGRLGDDPEVRQVGQQNRTLGTFSVCTTNVLANGNEIAEWHRCTAWGFVASQLKGMVKGDEVLVIGRSHTSSYERDGVKNSRAECNVESVAKILSNYTASQSAPEPSAPAPKPPTPAPGGAGPFPFEDAANGIVWPAPNGDGTSVVADGGEQYAAAWNDRSNPTLGGDLYRLVNNSWEKTGQIPPSDGVPF
jgi:single stranded DNA-binding protein